MIWGPLEVEAEHLVVRDADNIEGQKGLVGEDKAPATFETFGEVHRLWARDLEYNLCRLVLTSGT